MDDSSSSSSSSSSFAACILAVGTACPELYITQSEALAFYEAQDLLPPGQQSLYRRLLSDGPVKGRYFGLQQAAEIIGESSDSQILRFTDQARKIAAEACRQALAQAGCAPDAVGGIVVNTCTGYLCPGLTSYLIEDLALPNNIKALDIMGMGCGAAIPNLESGCGMLYRTRGKPVLCVAVEICSATHMIDDDPGLTVSNCIFGDGAAAVLLGPGSNDGPALLDFETGIFPEHREALRYRTQQGRLRNTLSRRVPVIGAACLEKVTRSLLARHAMDVADVAWWAVHAGGTTVLDQVAARLGLKPATLQVSHEVFATHGNMSSPTVLFALRRQMEAGNTKGPGLLLAFGAGFSAFAALACGEKKSP